MQIEQLDGRWMEELLKYLLWCLHHKSLKIYVTNFYLEFYTDCHVITIDLLQARFNEDVPSEIHSKIHLVDLAGRLACYILADEFKTDSIKGFLYF